MHLTHLLYAILKSLFPSIDRYFQRHPIVEKRIRQFFQLILWMLALSFILGLESAFGFTGTLLTIGSFIVVSSLVLWTRRFRKRP